MILLGSAVLVLTVLALYDEHTRRRG